ncbi:MAG: alpha/beta hydrolase [Deltaproteobacteria bacterium]|jgi:acetyl esterase/lipase|nr:alpha/beta hydrolase [Deltaproteobacteria bacterium]
MHLAARVIAAFLILFLSGEGAAQDVYELWAGQEKPHYRENDLEEYEKVSSFGVVCAYDVTEPTLSVYRAEGENSGRAVILLPGGGYELVAIYHEGHDLAKLLAKRGITTGVLKYRLPRTESSDQPHLVPLADTRRALELLRAHAEKYGFAKDKLGVVGFSAGSHLATVASLWRSDDEAENPNFSGLIYGVTELDAENRKWLEESLYHRKMTDGEVAQNTLLELVSKDTPPAFLVHAYDDDVCNVRESTLYAEKCVEHGVPVEMHLFPKGGHGFGAGRREDGTAQWIPLFVNWLKSNI